MRRSSTSGIVKIPVAAFLRLAFFALIFASFSGKSSGKSGDTILVTSHSEEFVVTDPQTGSRAYQNVAVFPPDNVKYRKVILSITYKCPDGLRCGEWDYIDMIKLKRSGMEPSDTIDYEIARMISPYGSRFDSNWQFTWQSDVTDFSSLLHDSTEIEFVHTGYESNTDRGWLVTIQFRIILGEPAFNISEIQKLWTGSFPYGDTSVSIEEFLQPVKINVPANSEFAKFRILQTGHGMDDLENCAEFCAKYRDIVIDGNLFDRSLIWKRCGDNPLYPQAGTWIFDRAGWCPGDVVVPSEYLITTKGKDVIELDINMEPYLNRSKPSANYFFSSFIFFSEKPAIENDIALEEIIAPSRRDAHSRSNPICFSPELLVKNNGFDTVTSLEIAAEWGGNRKMIDWKGRILPLRSEKIILEDIVFDSKTSRLFVELNNPNGIADISPDDNSANAEVYPVPVYDGKLILSFMKNLDTLATQVRIFDSKGKSIFESGRNTSENSRIHCDTLDLEDGCYRLEVSDPGGDGLGFWFNPEAGYGYIRMLDIDGKLIKSFGSDFGNGIIHNFRVERGAKSALYIEEEPVFTPFPPRNPGIFEVDIFFNEPSDFSITVRSEEGAKIYEKSQKAFKEGMLKIDISDAAEGIYFLRIETDSGKTIERRIRVKRDN